MNARLVQAIANAGSARHDLDAFLLQRYHKEQLDVPPELTQALEQLRQAHQLLSEYRKREIAVTPE